MFVWQGAACVHDQAAHVSSGSGAGWGWLWLSDTTGHHWPPEPGPEPPDLELRPEPEWVSDLSSSSILLHGRVKVVIGLSWILHIRIFVTSWFIIVAKKIAKAITITSPWVLFIGWDFRFLAFTLVEVNQTIFAFSFLLGLHSSWITPLIYSKQSQVMPMWCKLQKISSGQIGFA